MKHLFSTVMLAVTLLLSTQLAADKSILCESICKDVSITHCEGSRSFSTGNNAYDIQLTSNQEGVKVTEAKAYANEAQKVGVGLLAQFNNFISVEESCASHNTATAVVGVGYGFMFQDNIASEITDSVAKHNKTADIFIGQLP